MAILKHPSFNLPRGRLYLITNDAVCSSEKKLLRSVDEALDAGVQWIQFRPKPGGPFEEPNVKLQTTLKLKKLCTKAQARLFINDDVLIAQDCGIDLHLGQNDTPVEQARNTLHASQLIGITCHNDIQLARNGLKAGASYTSFGAFFSSQTKPKAQVIPTDILTKAQALNSCKVAIGGITLENAPELFAKGADIIAVSGAILTSSNIYLSCKKLMALASQVPKEPT